VNKPILSAADSPSPPTRAESSRGSKVLAKAEVRSELVGQLIKRIELLEAAAGARGINRKGERDRDRERPKRAGGEDQAVLSCGCT
jgi:hypothetical protein